MQADTSRANKSGHLDLLTTGKNAGPRIPKLLAMLFSPGLQ